MLAALKRMDKQTTYELLDLVHVPFNGGGPALAATLGGHTPISFGALPPAVQHVKDGKLRALAITSSRRAAALPEVPTMADDGHAEVAADIWQAVLVPAGTPPEIVGQLNRAIVDVITQPRVKQRMAALGYEPIGTPPAESEAEMRRELAKWSKVVRDAAIKLG
jgi:tripartite-type tricarboxylate transporter receptor subunit TctC